MAVRIRLRRVGRKKNPVYRIIVADSRSPRDGRFIEAIGHYSPRQREGGLDVNGERASYWLDVGAQPSDTVRSLLRRAGVLRARHEQRAARGQERVARERAATAIPVREGEAPADAAGAAEAPEAAE
jgi:small subunit ribosomal protein S16